MGSTGLGGGKSEEARMVAATSRTLGRLGFSGSTAPREDSPLGRRSVLGRGSKRAPCGWGGDPPGPLKDLRIDLRMLLRSGADGTGGEGDGGRSEEVDGRGEFLVELDLGRG